MSTDAYLDAKAAYDQAYGDIRKLAEMVQGVANALTYNPARFSFSNTTGGFPAEVVFARDSISANADHWPSAAAINEKLATWHKAEQAMRNTWQAVQQERRAGLVPPPPK